MVACGPPKLEQIEEVEGNETAFVIPMEAGTDKQKQFESVEFLESKKVAVKRVSLNLRKQKTGRMYFSYKWIPTERVIRVNRSPVTREWIMPDSQNRSSTKSNSASIEVESRDSIGFAVGINITAHVDEKDTAKYLYYHPAKALAEVIDSNIRGYVTMKLSEKFGALDLEECKQQKNQVLAETRDETIEHFTNYGITISALGLSEGLAYESPEIQKAIDDAYVAEMQIKVEEQKALAQEQTNKQLLAKAQGDAAAQLAEAEGQAAADLAKAEGDAAAAEAFAQEKESRTEMTKLEIELMRAQAALKAAENWKGDPPRFLLNNGGENGGAAPPFLFQLDPATIGQ